MSDQGHIHRPGNAPPQTSPTVRALVLDDSSFDRHRIRRLANILPFDVQMEGVATIDELEVILDRRQFDVVLLDYHLASGNGFDALERLRANLLNAACPAIMLTGYDTSDLAVRSIRSGCSEYLSKEQLSARTLSERILSALARDRAEPSDPGPGATPPLDREDLLAAAMRRYVAAIEPKIGRAVQSLRHARRMAPAADGELAGHLADTEAQCLRIWSALVDPRTIAGAGDRRT